MPEAKFPNPAIQAIEQAKYRIDELLEESRSKLNHLGLEVNKAAKVLDDAVIGRDRQASLHAGLQQQLNELNKSQRILEKAIKQEDESKNAKAEEL